MFRLLKQIKKIGL